MEQVTLNQLKPYIAISVFQSENSSRLFEELTIKLPKILTFLKTAPTNKNGKLYNEIIRNEGYKLGHFGVYFAIESGPSWLGAFDSSQEATDFLLNVEHHFILLSHFPPYIIVNSSHSTIRNLLCDLIEYGTVRNDDHLLEIETIGERLDDTQIQNAFTRGRSIKQWLNNRAPQTVNLADKKTLEGINLTQASDPLQDFQYSFSAVISAMLKEKNLPRTKDNEVTIGYSRDKYKLWKGPSKDLKGYEETIEFLLNLYEGKIVLDEENLLSYLAKPLNSSSIKDLKDGFDVKVNNPNDDFDETLSGEQINRASDEYLSDWQKRAYYLIDETATNPDDSAVVVDAYYTESEENMDSVKLMKIKFQPYFTGNVKVSLKVRVLKYYIPKDDKRLVSFDYTTIFGLKHLIIYYGSGHTIQNNALFKPNFANKLFEKWLWLDFENINGVNYNLSQEKPTVDNGKLDKNGNPIFIYDPTLIGSSISLFCYTKNHLFKKLNDELQLDDDSLLLCDDGSGEIGDFLMLGKKGGIPHFLFIHIKATKNSNKNIAVDRLFELTSMAKKNLTDLIKVELIDRLKNRGGDSKENLVWDLSGNQLTRQHFIDKLEKSNLRPSHPMHTVLFLPRIQMKSWQDAVDSYGSNASSSGRIKQVNNLLVVTESVLQRFNSSLYVVGINK